MNDSKLKTRKNQDSTDKAEDTGNTPESYFEKGFSPLPLKHHSKKPAIKWSKYQSQQPTKKQVTRWNYKNIGLLCGKAHNLLVVDLDSDEAIHWFLSHQIPASPSVSTSNGQHIYFKYPEDLSLKTINGFLGKEIDIKASGYVVAPGSIHPSGAKYKFNLDLSTGLAEIPEWLREKLTTSKSSTTAKSTVSSTGSTSQSGKKHPSVSSKSSKNTKKLKNPQKVDTSTKTINDLLNHKVFSGKAKSGSCNGRYLSHLITSFRLNLDKAKAIKATSEKYPQLDKSTIRDSAKQVYKQGYGLSPNKMVELDIPEEQAKSLFDKLKEVTGGYCEIEHRGEYQSREEFNKSVFRASLSLTLAGIHHTTYKQFADLSGCSQSTLAHRDSKELPQFVEIKSINGKGIVVYNYLPIFLNILAQVVKYLFLHTALKNTPLQNSYVCNGGVGSCLEVKREKNIINQSSGSRNNNSPPN